MGQSIGIPHHNERYSASSATDPPGENHPTGSILTSLFVFVRFHAWIPFQNLNKPDWSHLAGFTKPTIQVHGLFCADLLILQKLPSFYCLLQTDRSIYGINSPANTNMIGIVFWREKNHPITKDSVIHVQNTSLRFENENFGTFAELRALPPL